MKQNCSDPESLIVRSTADKMSLSAGVPAPARSGLSINSFGAPAKDAAPSVAVLNGHRKKPELEDITMQAGTDKLVVLVTKGIESELSSVDLTIANGGLTDGLKVSFFMTSNAIDLVRRVGHLLTQF